MPLLFSLSMHMALVTVKSKLKEGEKLFVFLDDPKGVLIAGNGAPKQSEHQHQSGQAKIWSWGGHEPAGAAILTAAARREKPEAVVWRGDPLLPPSEQGVRVLGAPLNQPEYVLTRLSEKAVEHDR